MALIAMTYLRSSVTEPQPTRASKRSKGLGKGKKSGRGFIWPKFDQRSGFVGTRSAMPRRSVEAPYCGQTATVGGRCDGPKKSLEQFLAKSHERDGSV